MECKFCGEEMPDDGKFCPYCGVDNSDDGIREEQEPVQEATEAEPDVKKARKVATISGCIAAMMVLALLLFVGVKGIDTEQIKGWFDWEIFRENNVLKQDSYTVSDKKAEKKGDTVVATLDGVELTNTQLQVVYWSTVSNFLSSTEGSYAVYYYGLDYTKPLDEQVCTMYDESMTWQQYFVEQALFSWQRYQALYNAAMQANYQLPEDVQQYLETFEADLTAVAVKNGYASADELLAKELGAGVGVEDYRQYVERSLVAEYFFNAEMDKIEATTEEMETYFTTNEETLKKYGITKDSGLLVDYRQILVKAETSKDADGNEVISDEAWADCLEKVNKLLSAWQEDPTEDHFGELANENSDDNDGEVTNGGLVQNTGKNDLTTVDVRHILIKASGTAGDNGKITFEDEDAAAAAKAKAEEILARWLENPTEEYFAELANECSEDKSGNVTDGGIYENVAEGKMVANFNDWCFDESRQSGDYGIVETQYGYHIMYFVHRDGEADQWLFAEGRQESDYAIVKTDDGYVLLYYVSGEDGWIVYSRSGVLNEKAYALLDDYANQSEIQVSYGKIALAEISLG